MKINNLDKYLEPLRHVLKKEGKREKEIEEEIITFHCDKAGDN